MKKLSLIIVLICATAMLFPQTPGHSLGFPVRSVHATQFRDDNYSYRYLLATSRLMGDTGGGSVWGCNSHSHRYTDDSRINTVLRHWYGNSLGERRIVEIYILPGYDHYVSTTRNGVTTSTYPEWPGSYRVTNSYPLSTPSTNASNLIVSNRTENSITYSWTRGNGNRVAVFMRAGNTSLFAQPTNYTNYTASTTFGSGTQASNNYFCVFNGTGTSVTVSNLQPGVTYQVNIVEWNYPYDDYQTYQTTGYSTTVNTYLLPSVSTQAVSGVTALTATGNGNLTSLGFPNPNQHGHCWNTTGTPTIANSKTELGAKDATGAYTSSLTELSANTLYYVRAYAASLAGTAYGGEVTFTTLPLAAASEFPEDEADEIAVLPALSWDAPEGGCDNYRIYLGTDTPPTNVLNGTIHGGTTYTAPALQYNTLYYWQIVPFNTTGDAEDCPVWSFITTDVYVNEDIPPVDPGNGGDIINPKVIIPEVEGEFTPDISADWNPTDKEINLPNVGLYLHFTGVNLYDRYIEIDPDLGFIPVQLAYRFAGENWTFVQQDAGWTMSEVFFTTRPFDGRNEDELEIVFPAEGDQTLPVELSSFTATTTANSDVELIWVAETETNMLGYRVYRGHSGNLNEASIINTNLIPAANSSTAQKYTYIDVYVEVGDTYYYWLQSLDLDLTSSFHGPISIIVGEGEAEDTPSVSLRTELVGAFPNPFNPYTRIAFTLEERSQVTISVYNITGQLIRTLVSGKEYSEGSHLVLWDGMDSQGRQVGSGIYLYRMITPGYDEAQKMLLLK